MHCAICLGSVNRGTTGDGRRGYGDERRRDPIEHGRRDGRSRIQSQLRTRSTSVIRARETQQGKMLGLTVLFKTCDAAGSLAAFHAGFRNMYIAGRGVAAAITVCDGTAFCARGSFEVRNEELHWGKSRGFCRTM